MEEEKKVEIDYSAESTLETIATIFLLTGIIATLICAFSMIIVRDPDFTYIERYTFSPEGFIITLTILLSTLASWASMKVFANISRSLKEIKNKIK